MHGSKHNSLWNTGGCANKHIKASSRKMADAHMKKRLANVKCAVDTTSPSTRYLSHLANNLKREWLQEIRYAEIDFVNRLLLQKMSSIMRERKSIPQARKGAVSLNAPARLRKAQEIQQDNQKLLNRIQNAKGCLNVDELDEFWKKQQEYQELCCEYPRPATSEARRKQRMDQETSEVVKRRNEETERRETEALLLSEEVSRAKPDSDTVTCMKQGRKIEDQTFIVEMKTNGRTLHIQAYESDTQKSYDLVVNEDNHRKLSRRCNGNYEEISGLLKIQQGRLTVQGVSEKQN